MGWTGSVRANLDSNQDQIAMFWYEYGFTFLSWAIRWRSVSLRIMAESTLVPALSPAKHE